MMMSASLDTIAQYVTDLVTLVDAQWKLLNWIMLGNLSLSGWLVEVCSGSYRVSSTSYSNLYLFFCLSLNIFFLYIRLSLIRLIFQKLLNP